MSDPRDGLSADLDEFAASLSRLIPNSSPIDRDRLMFRLGQSAGAQHARRRQFAWRAAALMAGLLAGAGTSYLRENLDPSARVAGPPSTSVQDISSLGAPAPATASSAPVTRESEADRRHLAGRRILADRHLNEMAIAMSTRIQGGLSPLELRGWRAVSTSDAEHSDQNASPSLRIRDWREWQSRIDEMHPATEKQNATPERNAS